VYFFHNSTCKTTKHGRQGQILISVK
jgi:hypothetical protein